MNNLQLHLWCVVLALFASTTSLFGQTPQPNYERLILEDQVPFSQIQQDMRNWIDTEQPPLTGALKGYLRMEQFWSARAHGSDTDDGCNEDFSNYSTALRNYVANPTCDGSNGSVWEPIGNNNVLRNNIAQRGHVSAIYCDPNNTDFMLAGANASGIWKSTDGGTTWRCVTDEERYPGLGIGGFIAPPQTAGVLYATTGVTTYGRGIGFGVIKSVDGGETWTILPDLNAATGDAVSAIAYDKAATSNPTIYVTAGKEVFSTTDGGMTWNNITPPSTNNDHVFNDLETTENSLNTVFVSSTNFNGDGEIWYSSDAGLNWTQVDGNLVATLSSGALNGSQKTLGDIWQTLSNPSNPFTGWYAYGSAVWNQVIIGTEALASTNPNVSGVLEYNFSGDPLPTVVNTDYLFNAEIFIPANVEVDVIQGFWGGANNLNIITLPAQSTDRMEIVSVTYISNANPGAFHFVVTPQGIVAGTALLTIDKVVVKSTVVPKNAIAIDYTDNALYVLYGSGAEAAVNKSTNNGVTFTDLGVDVTGASLGSKLVELEVNEHSNGVNYYCGGLEHLMIQHDGSGTLLAAYSSQMGGTSMAQLHDDARSTFLIPSVDGTGDRIYVGHDGGVSVSFDGGTTWANKSNSTLGITQYYGIDVHYKTGSYVLGGTQDNSTFLYDEATGTWDGLLSSGDGGHCIIDPNDNTTRYGQSNEFLASGVNVDQLYSFFAGGQRYLGMPIEQDPHHPSNIYFGADRLGVKTYATAVPSATQELITYSTGNNVTAIAFPPSTPDFFYFGMARPTAGSTLQEKLYKYEYNPGGQPIITDLTNYLNGGVYTANPLEAAYCDNVTSIAIDPNDADRLWVSFDGIQTENDAMIDKRSVWYSEDGGQNWADISTGLPGFPVNKLLYQDNSNDILYAGTDVGVYVWDAGEQTWNCMDNGLPVTIVTDLGINYCTQKLVASTFGRGLWQADVLPSEVSIATNTTLSNDQTFYSTIAVEPGFTLTINPGVTISMARNTKILVKPGARLIVDGATITNACGLWTGIEVQGVTAANQYTLNGSFVQGYAEFKNGAVVEYAKEAVSNWEAGNWAATGGIIIADHATFRNNWRAVSMLKYQNFNSSGKKPDRTRFNQCTFVSDNSFMQDEDFYAFITMYEVAGINITGCSFADERGYLSDLAELGNGIITINSKFSVKAQCNPLLGSCDDEVAIDRTSFTGLQHGIWAANVSGKKSYVVDQCLFERNIMGVRSESVNDIAITRTQFIVGANLYAGAGPIKQEGVVVNTGTRFHIEGNDFVVPANATFETVGVRIANSGTDGNSVYRNSYNGFTVANLANYLNRDATILTRGLDFECNTQQNDVYDIAVTGIDAIDGIAQFQGSNSAPMGNTFSLNGNNPASDFDNEAPNPVEYFYSSLVTNEDPINYFGVIKFDVPSINDCPSELESGNGGLEPTEKTALRNQSSTNMMDYNSLKLIHTALIDGGNTNDLVIDLTLAWPEDTWDLRASLLAESPNLSDEVLREAGERADVLPHAILYEIVAANPDVARDPSFQEFLRVKADPMPEYMIQLLAAGSGVKTYRTVLESEIAYHYSEMAQAVDLLLFDALNDTIGLDTVSVDTLLAFKQSLYSDLSRVDDKIENGEFNAASALISAVVSDPTHPEELEQELLHFQELKELLIVVGSENRTLFELTAQELTDLQEIAANSTLLAGTEARNILRFVNGETHVSLPLMPSTLNEERFYLIPSDENTLTLGKVSIGIKPNPAKDWTNIYWQFGEDQIGVLNIQSVDGRVVLQRELNQPQGEWVWDTRNIEAGVYVCSLKVAGEQTVTKRIVIQ